jgi:hypothetical protein
MRSKLGVVQSNVRPARGQSKRQGCLVRLLLSFNVKQGELSFSLFGMVSQNVKRVSPGAFPETGNDRNPKIGIP